MPLSQSAGALHSVFSVPGFEVTATMPTLTSKRIPCGHHNDETRYCMGKMYLVLLFDRLTNRYCTVQIDTGTESRRNQYKRRS
jgi:hypothetical protein